MYNLYRVSCYTSLICCEDLHLPAATWSMCIMMGAESFLISNVYKLIKQKKKLHCLIMNKNKWFWPFNLLMKILLKWHWYMYACTKKINNLNIVSHLTVLYRWVNLLIIFTSCCEYERFHGIPGYCIGLQRQNHLEHRYHNHQCLLTSFAETAVQL